MKKVIAVLWLIFPWGVAQAEWEIYYRDQKLGDIYYDPIRIKRISDDVIEVWIKRFNDAEKELMNRDGFDITPPGMEHFSHEMQKHIVNCSSRETGLASHFDYAKNGSILQSLRLKSSEIKFSSGSWFSELLVKMVCSR